MILGNLIRDNCDFQFGTTATSPQAAHFFKFLKDRGYKIHLIHITAPDEVRWNSIQERDKSFVQTTEQDIQEKGKLLPQRIQDTYLKYADKIHFIYRGEVNTGPSMVLGMAAEWIRTEESAGKAGVLRIWNEENYAKVKALHNAAIEALGKRELLSFSLLTFSLALDVLSRLLPAAKTPEGSFFYLVRKGRLGRLHLLRRLFSACWLIFRQMFFPFFISGNFFRRNLFH
ncbi:MAG: hypothetical protein KGJ02_04910 [Verrucomicrobiota bacterium]|nr:hypothetical protein [Verrucomicrobiota bacterium]